MSAKLLLYEAVETVDDTIEPNLDKINKAVANGGDVNFFIYKELPGWKKYRYEGSGLGNSALHLACWKGLSRQIIERLLELGADVNLKSLLDGYNAIMCASRKGYRDIVELLLDRGANIHEKNNKGINALMCASSEGHKDIVELLLDRGANIHEKNNNGINALIYASSKGHKDIVELLLDRGADIKEKDCVGSNALLYASYYGHRDVVELLLDQGADIHDKNNEGGNALMEASLDGHCGVAKLLLERGMNISEKVNDGYSAYSLAKLCNNVNFIYILERWPVTMWIIALQNLWVYHQLDASSTEDLWQYIGSEQDYI
jgi:serine/threonine-protein phosphatase 6 regulatory ankyrin repeat subunit B